jgi:urea ABC transporter permease protein UrtB
MVSSEILVGLILNAISAISILALAALGLAIIFGFMGVINLTHGAFITIGGYVTWFVSTELGIGFWVGFLVAPFVVAVIGLLSEILVVQYLYDRLLDTLLATWGLALAIREAISLVYGESTKSVTNPFPGSVDLGITTYPSYRLFLIALGVFVFIAVFALFNRTNFGVRLRAVIQDEEAAELLGINHQRMYHFSYSFGAALAGLAGAALSPIVSVTPDMGSIYLINSFFAVIVGGTGSLLGVIPGSILVAGATNMLTFSLSPILAQTLVFATIILILSVRPRAKRALNGWRDNI